jgi:hypothetical protein
VAADVREWIAEVELVIPQMGAAPGAVIEVAAGSARGPLHKEVERFLQNQPNRNGTPWNLLRDHIRTTFLSQNEGERLKAEAEMMQQASYDSVAAYNLRFREAAQAAYPVPRSADAERTLIHAYVHSLHSYDIKKKTLAGHPANVAAALVLAEQLDADRDQVDRIVGKRQEEPMEVSVVKKEQMAQSDMAAVVLKMQEEMAKMAVAVEKLSRKPTYGGKQPFAKGSYQPRRNTGWKDDQRVCFSCHKVGHIAANCRSKDTGTKVDSMATSTHQGN